jgi:hypothetical protein
MMMIKASKIVLFGASNGIQVGFLEQFNVPKININNRLKVNS